MSSHSVWQPPLAEMMQLKHLLPALLWLWNGHELHDMQEKRLSRQWLTRMWVQVHVLQKLLVEEEKAPPLDCRIMGSWHCQTRPLGHLHHRHRPRHGLQGPHLAFELWTSPSPPLMFLGRPSMCLLQQQQQTPRCLPDHPGHFRNGLQLLPPHRNPRQ